MRVENLTLTNFRSYRSASFDFAERTVLVGQNAAGKTNLLEALYLLASTKSFRADKELEMISWGEAAGQVKASFSHDKRSYEVAAGLGTGARSIRKSFTVDNSKKKARDVITRFPMVLFSADDIRLIDGAPGRRRRALDLALSQGSRSYHELLSTYGKVLASRNRLLEQINSGEAGTDELDFWDGKLADSGQALISDRSAFTDFLNDLLPDTYQAIATRDTRRLTVAYKPLTQDMASDIPRRRAQDIAIGTTTAGPHRDDWSILLGNRPLPSFGSGGEYRSAMLAFRMAEAAWLSQALAVRPVLLLDDVFSELDEYRRESLLESLPASQVIITTPEKGILPGSFAATATVTQIASRKESHV